MLRKLALLLLLVPVAARAQSAWEEGQWAGDDQYSAPQWDDPRDDSYAPQEQYENPPPPPDDESADSHYDVRDAPVVDRQHEVRAAPVVDDFAVAGPSIDDFRSGLQPYGRWIDTPDYGWVWQPRNVSYRWQPYWDGRWIWTTAGWTWVSDEPWGWATYHYGRWAAVDGVGWVWLPGRVWAPAWVAWRWGGGYAGWCPLGPRGVVYREPHRWVFVSSPDFLTPVRHHAVPINVVTRVWTRAQPLPVVRPTPRAGPPPRIVEQHTRVLVRVVPIVEAESRNATRPLASGAVPVWRPRTVPYSRPAAPATPFNPPDRAERPRVTPGGTVMRGEPRAIPVEQRPTPVYRMPVDPRQRPDGAEQRPQQMPRAEQRPEPRAEQRPQQTPRAQQRPPAAQPARAAPNAAPPARRAEPEGHARPPAEPHARPIEAARDREKN